MFSAVFSIEKGFFFTTIQMLKQPGQVVYDYVNGKIKPYFPPFRFVFIWITLYSLVLVWSGLLDLQMGEMNAQNPTLQSPDQAEMAKKVQGFIQSYFNFIGLLSLPFIALASKWVVDKNDGNFAEHFIANTYAVGVQSAIMLVSIPLFMIIPSQSFVFSATGFGTGIIFLGLIYRRWFSYSFWSSLGRSIAANIIGTGMFILSSMIIGIIVAIIWMLLTK